MERDSRTNDQLPELRASRKQFGIEIYDHAVLSATVDEQRWQIRLKDGEMTKLSRRLQVHGEELGPGRLSIRSTQHCELNVALHLLQLRTLEGFPNTAIEVGCSKASCFWCHKYINELNSVLILSGPVVVRATHGKMTNEWMVPQAAQGFEDECNRAKQNVFDTIGKSIRAIFAAGTDLRRKSDSQPLGASGHPRSKAMLQEERLEKPLFGSA